MPNRPYLNLGIEVKNFVLASSVVLFASCGAMGDNLLPSGADKRHTAAPGTTGGSVTQNAADITIPDVAGGNFTLSAETAANKTVVLYFTMWCPVCDTHQQHMQNTVLPNFPSVEFCLVDYVSGSASAALTAQNDAGWAGAPFRALADNGSAVSAFHATMGTTVVIDKTGVVRMNEDYKDGVLLQSVLAGLP